LVGTSRKDSTKDEVRTSTLGYVQALRKAGHEPRQGSAMSAWGAPSPRSRPAGVEVSLDKADAVIEGLRLEWSPRRRCCILAACRAALRDRPFVSDRFFFVTVRLLKRRRELDNADFQ
jgi:hypothetical protein